MISNILKVYEAIKLINPSAKVSISGSNIDDCTFTWTDTTPISKEDIKAKIPIVENKEVADETAAENNKASGKQKLKDLGLDDDEIKALMGA